MPLQALPSPLPSDRTSSPFIPGKRPRWSVHSACWDLHQKLVQNTHTHTLRPHTLLGSSARFNYFFFACLKTYFSHSHNVTANANWNDAISASQTVVPMKRISCLQTQTPASSSGGLSATVILGTFQVLLAAFRSHFSNE